MGRRLRRLAATDAAWARGQLSGSQVAAISANLADDEATAMFAEHEAEVVPALTPLSVADTARAMQSWATAAEALRERPDPEPPRRSLHLSRTLDGRRELAASLDPEGGELLERALRLSASDDQAGEPERSPAQRRADSLVDLCRWFLDHQQQASGGRHRPHLNVTLDIERVDGLDDAIGRLFDGPPLDRATLERLLCDSGLHRVLMRGASSILDYGRTTYTVPPSLWAALGLREEHCRFPGCDRPISWCEAHHVRAGSGAATRSCPTSSCCVPATTTWSTAGAGACASTMTPPSWSPIPTGGSSQARFPTPHHCQWLW
jgi:hypothetical protein